MKKDTLEVGKEKSSSTIEMDAHEILAKALRILSLRLKTNAEQLNKIAQIIEELQKSASLSYNLPCRYLVLIRSGSFS